MVGISAIGSRSRFDFAVSSRPISNPFRDSMPTVRTNSVLYALKLFVASLVPTRANVCRVRPAQRDMSRLSRGPPTCWPPGMYRDGCDHHAPVHEAGQIVDLARVVAAI